MQQASQALVLDFGGVVSRTLFETHRETEKALDLAPNSLQWLGPFDPSTDQLWQDMQADKISERDYWMARTQEVGKLLGEDWQDMQTFVQRARGADPSLVIRPEALTTIQAAQQAGHKLAILSNELDLFYGAGFRAKLPFLADFDVIVDATYTHILKPDARAYQQCYDELGLPPEACVFVDDQLRNIKGAQAVNMQTVHFQVTDPKHSYSEALEKLGLSPSVLNDL